MKTNFKCMVCLAVVVFLTSCSKDVEILNLQNANQLTSNGIDVFVDTIHSNPDIKSPNNVLGDYTEWLNDIGAVSKVDFPKLRLEYQNKTLVNWTQYYFRSDGQLLKVRYSFPNSSAEVFSNDYYYDDLGKVEFIRGHDVYNFVWNNDRIIKALKYNGKWSGKSVILFTYNNQGQIVQKTENNLDFYYGQQDFYEYYDDGNLKSIESFYGNDYQLIDTFKLYSKTNFAAYTSATNLFYEFEIIPGKIVQNRFPVSQEYTHLLSSGYNSHDVYEYQYDKKGRVVGKSYGNTKIVYEYY